LFVKRSEKRDVEVQTMKEAVSTPDDNEETPSQVQFLFLLHQKERKKSHQWLT